LLTKLIIFSGCKSGSKLVTLYSLQQALKSCYTTDNNPQKLCISPPHCRGLSQRETCIRCRTHRVVLFSLRLRHVCPCL
uniref:Ovule protein n=1 Tax=Mesocestoides corti TaxID=53468 RepID=A0A5K3G0X6_MESCO